MSSSPRSRFGCARADGSRRYVGADFDAFADAIDSRGFKRERRNETPQIQAVTTAAASLSGRDSDAGYFTVSL